MARSAKTRLAEGKGPSYRGTLLLVALLATMLASVLLLIIMGPTLLDAIEQISPGPTQAPHAALLTVGLAVGAMLLTASATILVTALAIRTLRLLIYTRRVHSAAQQVLLRQ